jgi:hypothetical protein
MIVSFTPHAELRLGSTRAPARLTERPWSLGSAAKAVQFFPWTGASKAARGGEGNCTLLPLISDSRPSTLTRYEALGAFMRGGRRLISITSCGLRAVRDVDHEPARDDHPRQGEASGVKRVAHEAHTARASPIHDDRPRSRTRPRGGGGGGEWTPTALTGPTVARGWSALSANCMSSSRTSARGG